MRKKSDPVLFRERRRAWARGVMGFGPYEELNLEKIADKFNRWMRYEIYADTPNEYMMIAHDILLHQCGKKNREGIFIPKVNRKGKV